MRRQLNHIGIIAPAKRLQRGPRVVRARHHEPVGRDHCHVVVGVSGRLPAKLSSHSRVSPDGAPRP